MRTSPPRIFVGTLESGEIEFSACRAAILAQTGIMVTHAVISGLPEHEAHNALWEKWNKNKSAHDLFVKVDADTVLIDNGALFRIWCLFSEDPSLSGAQIYLHDHFSDSLIAGLNAFTPSVIFTPSASRLRSDHADSGHTKVLKPNDLMHLAPIGIHAPTPGRDQSLFYGYHRWLKGQSETLRKVALAHQSQPNESRRDALIGAFTASEMSGKFKAIPLLKKILRRFGMNEVPPTKTALLEAAERAERKSGFNSSFDTFIKTVLRGES